MQVLTERRAFAIEGGVALVGAVEASQSADLNRDGDRNDFVLQLVHLASGRVRNTGLDVSVSFPQLDPVERLAVFTVREDAQGADLNGDGDLEDSVLQVSSVWAVPLVPPVPQRPGPP